MEQNSQKKIAEMIRVNHAGETGAKVIYEGQISALKIKGDHATLKIVEKMYQQELVHLSYFENKIKEQKIRPTVMQPIWQIGGFALGFITAMIDKKSAMACTTAVEETIDVHYHEQLNELEQIKEDDNCEVKTKELVDQLKSEISKFREEELEHRNIGYQHNAKDFVLYKPLDCFIKFTTKLAIGISKKL
ncbi:2-nonaprenyl-3-methyl-6-methoxy-1,4-benzoquinol hydroxylase [Alphaproteobacteria bacterium]|nr:2-nonaprenyl-3-methyl-6-methoxy-1,4-benzoquinol hydroxylase [Alphaproteobacteria bacterium]